MAMVRCSQCGSPNPDYVQQCANCKRPLTAASPGAAIPKVSALPKAPPAQSPQWAFTIGLDYLRPLEKLLWEARSFRLTEAQVLALVKERGLVVTEHPAFAQVWNDPNREFMLVCAHSSHNTPEKKRACQQIQAEKIAVRTILHYFGLLERHEIWGASSPGGYAFWTCYERSGHVACSYCRAREGMIVPVGTRAIEVPHANCHCSLTPVTKDALGESQLSGTYDYLAKSDLARAEQFKANVTRCGWTMRSIYDSVDMSRFARPPANTGSCSGVIAEAMAVLMLCVVVAIAFTR